MAPLGAPIPDRVRLCFHLADMTLGHENSIEMIIKLVGSMTDK